MVPPDRDRPSYNGREEVGSSDASGRADRKRLEKSQRSCYRARLSHHSSSDGFPGKGASAIVYPFLIGFVVTLVGTILIAATRRWHLRISFDPLYGVQKVHRRMASRIGGIAVFVGTAAAAAASPESVRALLFPVLVSALFATSAGVVEDLRKKDWIVFRFAAAAFSGLVFCALTGYTITRVEIDFIDYLLMSPLIAVAFTTLALTGVTNAINIVDGFNGLASGTTVILLAAFTVVSFTVGDHDMALFCTIGIGVALGFMLVNFPYGYVFLGDGGAYFLGFVLACAAVMVPVRNPDISPWISTLVLAYPVTETLVSILRRIRNGMKPYRPDQHHLHMLVHRRFANPIAKALANDALANPVTGALMWALPMTSLILVTLVPYDRNALLIALASSILIYALLYQTGREPIERLQPSSALGVGVGVSAPTSTGTPYDPDGDV